MVGVSENTSILYPSGSTKSRLQDHAEIQTQLLPTPSLLSPRPQCIVWRYKHRTNLQQVAVTTAPVKKPQAKPTFGEQNVSSGVASMVERILQEWIPSVLNEVAGGDHARSATLRTTETGISTEKSDVMHGRRFVVLFPPCCLYSQSGCNNKNIKFRRAQY